MAETATEKKVRTCKSNVKDDQGKLSVCGRVLKGECPNRREHVHPFKTGFCAIGACEGERKQGHSGRNLKTCMFWKYCPCQCHTNYDTLFAMSGKPRVIVDNSGYSREHGDFWIPTLEERAAMHVAQQTGVTDAVQVRIESPLPGVIPDSYQRTFSATPTGRAARGELESYVQEFCDEYLVEKYADMCTPAWVAENVGKAHGINTPSSGAVDAVFKRWEAIGFAYIGRKPTRFIAYTADGVRLGLDAMKLKARDASKSKMSPTAALNRR